MTEPLAESDAVFILELLNSPGWIRHIGDRKVHSEADALRYIQDISKHPDVLYWTARKKTDGTALGVVTLIQRKNRAHRDIGFAFLPAFQGQGYAHEAAQAVIASLPDPTLLAITSPDNQASRRLIERLGFSLDRRLDEDGKTLLLYALHRVSRPDP